MQVYFDITSSFIGYNVGHGLTGFRCWEMLIDVFLVESLGHYHTCTCVCSCFLCVLVYVNVRVTAQTMYKRRMSSEQKHHSKSSQYTPLVTSEAGAVGAVIPAMKALTPARAKTPSCRRLNQAIAAFARSKIPSTHES